MAETAALLVEHRLPAVPWRQSVLSFPGPMAVRLGYDRALLGSVCQRFAARVMQTLRRLTKRMHGLASSGALHPGVLIVEQRFRNDLGLFVHLHATPSPREPPPDSPLLVTAFGMQLHAAVTVDGRDRSRLERLCRAHSPRDIPRPLSATSAPLRFPTSFRLTADFYLDRIRRPG